MAKKNTFDAEYAGLFDPQDEQLFDEKNYRLKKQLGVVAGDEEPVSVQEMLKALESLEAEKESIRGKRWNTGTDTEAEKKFKYGDVPEQVTETPSGKELRNAPGDLHNYDDLFSGDIVTEEREGPKEPKLGLEKTTVSKTPAKKGKPVGSSVSKEKIELSGDSLKPIRPPSWVIEEKDAIEKSKKQKPQEDDVPWSWKMKGPSSATLRALPGNPFEKGVEEDDATWNTLGILGGAGGLARKGLKSLFSKGGKEAVKGLSKAGTSAAESTAAEAAVPEARKSLMDKLQSQQDDMWDYVRAKGDEVGGKDALMFQDIIGKPAKGVKKGQVGRRFDLISPDTTEAAEKMIPRQNMKGINPDRGLRATLGRYQMDGEDVTSVTKSDIQRITKQLLTALNNGTITPQKYANFLRRLGRGDEEVMRELARAGMK